MAVPILTEAYLLKNFPTFWCVLSPGDSCLNIKWNSETAWIRIWLRNGSSQNPHKTLGIREIMKLREKRTWKSMSRAVPSINRRGALGIYFLFLVSRRTMTTAAKMNYPWAKEQLESFQKWKPERRKQRRKKRRLRKADREADHVPEEIVNSFYCLGIKKKLPQIKSSHAIDVGFQFLQVD